MKPIFIMMLIASLTACGNNPGLSSRTIQPLCLDCLPMVSVAQRYILSVDYVTEDLLEMCELDENCIDVIETSEMALK